MKRFLCLFVLLCLLFCNGCKKQKVQIGLMADLDSLPIAYAYLQGWLSHEIELKVFNSAPMRDSAFVSGNLVGCVSDLISAIHLADTGAEITAPITTGGRYALVKNSSSKNTVAISSGTIIEYFCDKFETDYEKTIIASMSERCSMLLQNKVGAAVLPEPFANYAVEKGCSYVNKSTETKVGVMLFKKSFVKSGLYDEFCTAYNNAVAEITRGADLSDSANFLGFPKVDTTKLQLNFSYAAPPDKATFDEVCEYMRVYQQFDGEVEYDRLCG